MSIRLMTPEDLIEWEASKRPWITHRMVPRQGWVMLTGAPKAGKSYLALGLGLAVANGEDWCGQRCEPQRVLYLDIDPPIAETQDRFRQIKESGRDIGGSGRFMMVHPDDRTRPLNILHPSGSDWLANVMLQAEPDLVIIDVIRELHAGDENDSSSMKYVCDKLTKLCGSAALLLLHHLKKVPDEIKTPDPMVWARGSSYMAGKVDSLWTLHRDTLRIDPRFDERQKIAVKQDEHGWWHFPEVEANRDKLRALMALCEQHPDQSHLFLSRLAQEQVGVSRATYYRMMAGRRCAHAKASERASVPATAAEATG